ncbi:hypothetical protein [Nocardia sp. XZ_19_369]|uniref:hypothetical protein n=1 Tax=Nocardia sp. XZ_19_369 TaxID=2769487 RepID=UPI00188DF548|nr:hypothetical protein [Nocardia sp. XZ_19_369]
MITADSTRRLGAHLNDIGAVINLVLHDVKPGPASELWSRFDSTLDALHAIIDCFVERGLARHTRLYFDDNYRSFYDLVLGSADLSHFAEVVVAVPISSLGRPPHGQLADLDQARSKGVRIAAHGYTHRRLADYDARGTRLPTPPGGRYGPPATTSAPLTENEVLYQLVETAERTDLFGAGREFVLPYGCYNATTLALNDRLRLFDHLSTTDFDLDVGQLLRPRLLITSTDTPDLLLARILSEVESPPCPNHP